MGLRGPCHGLTDLHGKEDHWRRRVQITRGQLEESSMCKSSLNAQAQEFLLVSEQQMDYSNYQIILHSISFICPPQIKHWQVLCIFIYLFYLFI